MFTGIVEEVGEIQGILSKAGTFELAISDEFEAEKFITHVLPLSEINKGIALTKSGEAIKVVLHPNEF